MHASSSALLAKKATVGQHELVRDSARHDRYERAADRPLCVDDDGPVVACSYIALCPLNKPGLSECVDWEGSSDSSVSILLSSRV